MISIHTPVVLKRIVKRSGWEQDIYVLVSLTDTVYTIQMTTHNGFKTGQKFILSGNIKNASKFCNQKQFHIINWKLSGR